MTFKVIRVQGQGQEMTPVPCRDYFLVLAPVVVDDKAQLSPHRSSCRAPAEDRYAAMTVTRLVAATQPPAESICTLVECCRDVVVFRRLPATT